MDSTKTWTARKKRTKMEMKREARRAKGRGVIGDEEDRRREIRGAEARGRENIDGEHEATQSSSTIFAVNLLPFVTNLFPSKRSVICRT